MRIQILSPYPNEIRQTILDAGDFISDENPDFIICYGHREIIREPLISQYAGRLINLHISYLPWGRGADPNFWSWVEGTPKGVTIHLIDSGVDTGDIIAQRAVELDPSGTLATTYEDLKAQMRGLFNDEWPNIRTGNFKATPQRGIGSHHFARERKDIWHLYALEYDAPVSDLMAIRERRAPYSYIT